jgi:cyclophilin family peptidyl-prolyl cis-trans isomerase/HEAT repeat protein
MILTRNVRAACVLAVLLIAARAEAQLTRTAAETRLLARMIGAEDARPRTAQGLAPLLEGLRARSAGVRAFAVRALGRLERDSLATAIAPLLEDSAAAVRTAAAHALGQAVLRGDAARARAPLAARLQRETDARVKAALAETLGRLRNGTDAEAASTMQLLLSTSAESWEEALGVARGLYFLARQPAGRRAWPAAAGTFVRNLMARPASGDSALVATARRARTVAAAAFVTSATAQLTDLELLLRDEHALVRREAAAGLGALRDTAGVRGALQAALTDRSPLVRYDALRSWNRLHPRAAGCAPVLRALQDSSLHVVLLAIDRLGAGCESGVNAAAVLDSLTGALAAAGNTGWHPAAHALVSLARLDSARAAQRLPRFTASTNPFVRAWAAQAAAQLRAIPVLRTLSGDANANVRTTAVEALAQLTAHQSDSIYIAQLTQEDSQLLRAAAAALDGTQHPRALPALLDALDRMSARKRETERDARVALIARIRQLGSSTNAARIQPYLRDFDSVIADSAANVLGAWTGTRPQPRPAALPAAALPTPARLDSLARARVLIEMADGGRILLRLFAWDAPTNAARFARLAQQRYFDGLTFHRVAANFVIQGGSPRANEYAGDGPYTRDEVGLPNWRGTVGLSTRGRDTGDAQIYVNLIDNIRLDHDYTVLAEVIGGMDIVDRVQEGALIRSITVQFAGN